MNRLLRITRTLHFRLTFLFIILLCASIAGYYFLLPYTVFSSFDNDDEEHWYKEVADDEIRRGGVSYTIDTVEALLGGRFRGGARKSDTGSIAVGVGIDFSTRFTVRFRAEFENEPSRFPASDCASGSTPL